VPEDGPLIWLIFGPIVRFILEEDIKSLIALVDASFPEASMYSRMLYRKSSRFNLALANLRKS
jgi:hypothetical protein